LLRRKVLKPDTIGLILTGGYTCNNKYSKKAIMWLLHMVQTDGVTIKHAPTDANTLCFNCLTSVLMVIVQKQIQFTSFSGVIFMAAPVNRFVTSFPQTETQRQPDMKG